jgi:hypothetical protein
MVQWHRFRASGAPDGCAGVEDGCMQHSQSYKANVVVDGVGSRAIGGQVIHEKPEIFGVGWGTGIPGKTANIRATKGQVWPRHLCSSRACLPRPASPSQCLKCLFDEWNVQGQCSAPFLPDRGQRWCLGSGCKRQVKPPFSAESGPK